MKMETETADRQKIYGTTEQVYDGTMQFKAEPYGFTGWHPSHSLDMKLIRPGKRYVGYEGCNHCQDTYPSCP